MITSISAGTCVTMPSTNSTTTQYTELDDEIAECDKWQPQRNVVKYNIGPISDYRLDRLPNADTAVCSGTATAFVNCLIGSHTTNGQDHTLTLLGCPITFSPNTAGPQ